MSRAKIIRMPDGKPDIAALEEAGRILKNGGLVAFPTETVYGLGGNALDPEASKKIYAAKGRPSDNPLIVHIADTDALPPLVKSIPEKAKLLARKCWPGPLTMIFEKSGIVPMETTGGLETVAVRLPDNEIARELIRRAGGYVAAPSANTSGRPSPTCAKHVEEDLADTIDMILDGGDTDIGLESTIVDFTSEVPMILRPGFYNLELLSGILGEVRTDPGVFSENPDVRPKAPGMRYRHYAPKAELFVVEGAVPDVCRTIRALAEQQIRAGKKVGVICAEETFPEYGEGLVRCIGSRQDEETIAQHLYATLRDFDKEGVDCIYTEAFYTPQMGTAIMNRLLKAAGQKRIQAEES